MKKITLLLTLCLAVVGNLIAQTEDIEHSKDHPLFNRMPNVFIVEYAQNFDLVELRFKDSTSQMEGTKTFISYGFNAESGAPPPSFYQIVKNYENAVVKNGGKRCYYGDGRATLFVRSADKDVWVDLTDFSGSREGCYSITILEMEGMKQDIDANVILDALNKDGYLALYINFDTGKSTIQADSQEIIDQIAALLKRNPDLKVSIEGHTDNVGSAPSNQTLSENRSKAVVDAVVAKGVGSSRMTSKGWGAQKPIADNRTEEGRALNRRVEIVKL